jgi:N-acetylmuramoyl-L-alanine amidase
LSKNLNKLLNYNHLLDSRTENNIQIIIIHCTELPDLITAREYGEKIVYKSGTGNSGHYYIDKDGKVYQWVENNRIAHHVKDHNKNSIGIEIDNIGRYPNWFQTNHQIMHEQYTTQQIDSLVLLINKLQKQLPSLQYITGHEDLDKRLIPSENDPEIYIRRKIDPGPLFPWEIVMKQISLINIGELASSIREKT